MMRIVTGTARGTKLYTLEGDETRPTTERAKEAIFSILYDEVKDRRVLDLYAGSGQMGLEAVSRGAASAVFVDNSRDAASVIQKNVEKTHMQERSRVHCMGALEYLKSCTETFDLVFIDPPYALGGVTEVLSLLCRGRLSPGAVTVTETAEFSDVTVPPEFTVRKQVRYGKAAVMILDFKGVGT